MEGPICFKGRPHWSDTIWTEIWVMKGSSHTRIGGKSILRRRNSKCEHPEPGLNLARLENRGRYSGTQEGWKVEFKVTSEREAGKSRSFGQHSFTLLNTNYVSSTPLSSGMRQQPKSLLSSGSLHGGEDCLLGSCRPCRKMCISFQACYLVWTSQYLPETGVTVFIL